MDEDDEARGAWEKFDKAEAEGRLIWSDPNHDVLEDIRRFKREARDQHFRMLAENYKPLLDGIERGDREADDQGQ